MSLKIYFFKIELEVLPAIRFSSKAKNIFLKIKPLLLAFAENIFYLGDVGSGQLVKLLHNSVCHGIFLMNCEILQAGENFGVSANKIINVFKKNPKPCLLYTSPSPRDATLSGMAA